MMCWQNVFYSSPLLIPYIKKQKQISEYQNWKWNFYPKNEYPNIVPVMSGGADTVNVQNMSVVKLLMH